MEYSDTKVILAGCIDTRNAIHFEIGEDGVEKSRTKFPDVDMLYGPYKAENGRTALQVAFAALSAKNDAEQNALVKGKTVGIIEDSGKIQDYWFENDPSTPVTTTTMEVADFSRQLNGVLTGLATAVQVDATYTLDQLIAGQVSTVKLKCVKISDICYLQLIEISGTSYEDQGLYVTYTLYDFTNPTEYTTRKAIAMTADPVTKEVTTGGEYVLADLVKKGTAYEVKDNLLIVTDEAGDKYAASLIPYVAPTKPTLTASWEKDLTEGSAGDVVITNADSHTCKIYYTTDGTAPTLSSQSVTLAAGGTATIKLVVDTSIQTETRTVKAAAVLNGLGLANVTTQTYTLNRKVKAPAISVSGNKYATPRIVSATCNTTGAAIQISVNGATYASYSAQTLSDTTTKTYAAGYFKVKATLAGWKDSDEISSSQIIVAAKKFYIGMGAASLADEAAIKALTSGQVKEQDTMAGSYDVARVIGSYLWICGSGTLTSVTASGFGVPLEAVTTVDGYNCYRSSGAMSETGTDTFTVK